MFLRVPDRIEIKIKIMLCELYEDRLISISIFNYS